MNDRNSDDESAIIIDASSPELDFWDIKFGSATPINWGSINEQLIKVAAAIKKTRPGAFADGTTPADFASKALSDLFNPPHLYWDGARVPQRKSVENALRSFLIRHMKNRMIDHFRKLIRQGEVSLDADRNEGNNGDIGRISAKDVRENLVSRDPHIQRWELQRDLRSAVRGNGPAIRLIDAAVDTSRAGNVNQQLEEATGIPVKSIENIKKFIRRAVQRP